MSSLPQAVSRAVYNRDGWHCRKCNKNSELHPHHVIFRSAGGSDDLNNLLTLCAKCHAGIHDGRLRLEVVQKLKDNLIVKFWKLKGWKD
jgi:5-methylcytosine-specific restriction endonuclease McrA